MLIVDRQSRLAKLIARLGTSDLEGLSRELDVSQSTIRRDVEALEKRGMVRRTHGGVIWVDDRHRDGANLPYVFDQRMSVLTNVKKAIAREAAKLVEPRQTILLDGGTTTYFMAQELLSQTLQIVTNSLPIANIFLNAKEVELILTGGILYPRYGVLLGPIADQALEAVHTTMMFLSVAGINAGSLYNQNLLLVQAERHMMKQAQKAILLADSTKFGQQALARLSGLDEIDVVVSDEGLSDAYRKQVFDAGCELIIARE